MGLKEMENEDYNMYQYIIRKKREDNIWKIIMLLKLWQNLILII
jgi:hypothetical protein